MEPRFTVLIVSSREFVRVIKKGMINEDSRNLPGHSFGKIIPHHYFNPL